ncbi:MAG: hypothetical protein HQK57_12380 [Deltaproteobacteria bacterium]|nr:hypothetical protein [Deltaproteobacteria bacterium]MBF0524843.1 hypothetical protein [Deltaproteobacteria bacterium]
MNKTIWLSFDIAIRGDLDGLYAWLDTYHAKECGFNLACLDYPDSDNLVQGLKKEIQEAVQLEKGDRIYVIYLDPNGRMVGKFLFGRRKAANWTGFGPLSIDEVDYGH